MDAEQIAASLQSLRRELTARGARINYAYVRIWEGYTPLRWDIGFSLVGERDIEAHRHLTIEAAFAEATALVKDYRPVEQQLAEILGIPGAA